MDIDLTRDLERPDGYTPAPTFETSLMIAEPAIIAQQEAAISSEQRRHVEQFLNERMAQTTAEDLKKEADQLYERFKELSEVRDSLKQAPALEDSAGKAQRLKELAKKSKECNEAFVAFAKGTSKWRAHGEKRIPPKVDFNSAAAARSHKPMEHPVLKRVDPDHVRAFMLSYRAYKTQVQALPEGLNKPFSIRQCLDQKLLIFLASRLGKEVEGLTNEEVTAWIKESISQQQNDYSPDELEKKMSSDLPWDLTVAPLGRMEGVFFKHRCLLAQYTPTGWDKVHPKKCYQHIMNWLEKKCSPLHKKIKKDVEDGKGEAKKDFTKFYQLVRKVMKENNDLVTSYEQELKKKGGDSKPKGRKRNQEETSGGKADGPPARKAKNAKAKDCWACGKKNHTLFQCRNTTKEDQKRIYKEKTGKGKLPVYSISKDQELTSYACQMQGTLNDQVEVSVCLDTGCPTTLICKVVIQKLNKDANYVHAKNPINWTLGDGKTPVRIVGTCQLDITLHLNGQRYTLRGVKCLVTRTELKEVLVGNDLLRHIGVDVRKMLKNCLEKGEVDTSGLEPEVWKQLIEWKQPESGRLSTVLPYEESDAINETMGHEECIEDMPTVPPRNCAGCIHCIHAETGELDPWGGNTEKEVLDAISEMLADAKASGASESFMIELKKRIELRKYVWRIRQGVDPPVKVAPMVIKLKPGATPVRMSSRRVTPIVRDFMKLEVDRQIAANLAYPNPQSAWCSVPFVVKKRIDPERGEVPLIDQFRMTNDLKKVNQMCEDTSWPMPNMDVILARLLGAKYFALFDVASGYWQFSLSECSREILSYMTDRGVYTPTRVVQGAKGSVAYFQSKMQEIIGDQLYESILLWLDDLLIFSDTETGLLDAIDKFLEKCETYGLKLHAKKCKLFKRKVKWCGREISPEGIGQDPQRLEGLTDLSPPETGADLQQFCCALNWMRKFLFDYAPTMSPLLTLLERVYKVAKGRTRRKAQGVKLKKLGWTEEHDKAFQEAKKMIEKACVLAHPDPKKEVCVFPDASDKFWGAVVTQIPCEDLGKKFAEQDHQPLAFLSHAFVGSQLNWAIVEKEAFAIVETCKRLDYILQRQEGFRLFTDHVNLKYIFSPASTSNTIKKHTASKLQRWAVTLMGYNYEIDEIKGSENEWADLLSRWGAKDRVPGAVETKEPPCTPIYRCFAVEPSPLCSTSFDWPSEQSIEAAQKSAIEDHENPPENYVLDESKNLWRLVDDEGAVWVPDSAKDLQRRLCIISHVGIGGHRGVEATFTALAKSFQWTSLHEDVKDFCQQCIHCLSTSGGMRVPRPLGEQIHATKPNEVLHFDFLYMKKLPKNGGKYILVLKDDFSNLVFLSTHETADADAVVEAITKWASFFGVPHTWISDQGSHFKNSVLAELSRQYDCYHHVTLAYCPWSNGTVESMMHSILTLFRRLLLELDLETEAWPDLVPMVQTALNHAPSKKLGYRSPIYIHTGSEAKRPIDTIVKPNVEVVKTLEDIYEAIEEDLEDLIACRDELHKVVKQSVDRERYKVRERHLRKSTTSNPNFTVGDYVLVAAVRDKMKDKLRVRWQGPRRITKVISPWIYEVEDLVHGRTREVHITRMKYFRDSSLEVTETIKKLAARSEATYEPSQFTGLRYNHAMRIWELYTHWRGFSDDEADWHPIESLAEDVPAEVHSYLSTAALPAPEVQQVLTFLADLNINPLFRRPDTPPPPLSTTRTSATKRKLRRTTPSPAQSSTARSRKRVRFITGSSK